MSMRVVLSILIFFGSCCGGYFVWRQAEKFSAEQSDLVASSKAGLKEQKTELGRIKIKNSGAKSRLVQLRQTGFFEIDRVRALDYFAGLGNRFSFSLQEDNWKDLQNGKKLTAKITGIFPHEGSLLAFLHRLDQGQLGLLIWEKIEISRTASGLALSATVIWFGVLYKSL